MRRYGDARVVRRRVPDADALEQLLRRARQRVDAQVHVLGAPTRRRARLEHYDAQAVGAATRREQRGRREPDDTGAGNEDGGSRAHRVSSTSGSPRAKPRQSARPAHRLAREQRFRARQQIERHEAQARGPQPEAGAPTRRRAE